MTSTQIKTAAHSVRHVPETQETPHVPLSAEKRRLFAAAHLALTSQLKSQSQQIHRWFVPGYGRRVYCPIFMLCCNARGTDVQIRVEAIFRVQYPQTRILAR